jgi:hypothetical protein
MVIVPVVVGKDTIDGPLKESVFILNVYREGIEVMTGNRKALIDKGYVEGTAPGL